MLVEKGGGEINMKEFRGERKGGKKKKRERERREGPIENPFPPFCPSIERDARGRVRKAKIKKCTNTTGDLLFSLTWPKKTPQGLQKKKHQRNGFTTSVRILLILLICVFI